MDNQKFLIDIAKENKYNNLSSEYNEKYIKWRTDPDNPYGFKYVYDVRERAYVDGEGYLESSLIESEKKTLSKCCTLIGSTMLIMLGIDLLKQLMNRKIFGIADCRNFYSHIEKFNTFNSTFVWFQSLFLVLKFILPLLFFKKMSHFKFDVGVPFGKSNCKIKRNASLMLFILIAFRRIFDFLNFNMLSFFKIDLPYYDYMVSDDKYSMICYLIVQYVLVVILSEFLFQGFMLQMLRQFGDLFAVVTISVFNSLILYEYVQLGYLFSVSALTGLITIKSGSLRAGCMINILSKLYVILVINFPKFFNSFEVTMIESVICMLFLVFAISIYFKISDKNNWSFDIVNNGSQLPTLQKYLIIITNFPCFLWIVSSIFMVIISVRFL